MKTAGLSLDQAPPIDLPFRFFLTAPLFAAAAGVVLAWQGEAVLASRWSSAALAVTHLLAVGFLTQIMCGALLQMLPVIAGSPVPAIRPLGTAVHLLLNLGAILLAVGFLAGGTVVLGTGAVCAAAALLSFLVPVGIALTRARGAADTILAMRLAAAALLVTVLLGLALAATVLGWIPGQHLSRLVDIHLTWGLLGWAGLLIIGVAFQVVPMFHVSPPYPRWMSRALLPLLAGAILVGSLLLLGGRERAADVAFGIGAAGFVLFAAITVRLQMRRERWRVDATLLHWWAAMASMAAGAVVWMLHGPPALIGVFLLVGVGVGLPSGMLFKIVPFLSWFHLQHWQLTSGRLDVRIPHMHSFLSEGAARAHFGVHLLTLTLLVASVVEPGLIQAAGLVLTLSALLLDGLLLIGARRQRSWAGKLSLASAQDAVMADGA